MGHGHIPKDVHFHYQLRFVIYMHVCTINMKYCLASIFLCLTLERDFLLGDGAVALIVTLFVMLVSAHIPVHLVYIDMYVWLSTCKSGFTDTCMCMSGYQF